MNRFASFFFVPLAALVACGGATTNLGNDATNDGGPSPTSNGSSGSSGSSGTTGSSGSSGSSGTSKDEDGGSAFMCGRITASAPPSFLPCPDNEYCVQQIGKCHSGGTCAKITVPPWNGQCTALVPVCGCDGKEYCSAEHAQASGTSVGAQGSCQFDCGPKQCNALNQYCEHGSGGPPPLDGGAGFEQWDCRTFPAGCLSADDLSCACLKAKGVTTGACSVQNGHVRTEQFFP